MLIPHMIVRVSRAYATLSPLLLFFALHASSSMAAGARENSTLVPVVGEQVQPAPHTRTKDQDPQAEPANHDGHQAEADVPGAESDHGSDTSADLSKDDSEHATENPRQGSEKTHDEQGHGDEAEEAFEVWLSPEQRQTLNLEIAVLEPRVIEETLRAPGEVELNAYATAHVTPRIEAQVLARHAQLGDYVEKGQPLVTLSSVDMAEAQGDLVVAEREWQRLTKLKGKFISESDYLEASVARQKALSSVLAYGMTEAQADALVNGASEKSDGTFELLAPRSGTLIRDKFVLGELVEPGRVLFEITDESIRWVEAQMRPEVAAGVSVGDHARIAYLDAWLDGRVSQIHHQLNEITRTQALRVEVPDPEHRLHPGVFVDVVVLGGQGKPVLAVPEAAVLHGSDGDWQVFVAEDGGAFRPAEVELMRTTGGMAVIEGLPAGTGVVIQGAFFLQSELAKSGFDIHQH